VSRLKSAGRITLHLDLVAGLPGDGYSDFLGAIDRVAALAPDHLQVELVKLLPGTPLRERAARGRLRFDPNPPYTVLATPELTFAQLEKLRTISRLLDLTWNAGCFPTFLAVLGESTGSLSEGLERLADDLVERAWLRFPLGREGLFLTLAEAVGRCWEGASAERLREALAYDLARGERIVPERAPKLFDTGLSDHETAWVRDEVRKATGNLRSQGVKLQHFAAVFRYLPEKGQAPSTKETVPLTGRTVCLFLYRVRSGTGMTVEELRLVR
jgi:anaerobic magnesium-protoporphyrin IX monomethyl ester cyclase